MSTLIFLHPATRGDSRFDRVVKRARSAEAVVGRASALVSSVARSRFAPGDRTILRLLASLVAHLVAPFVGADGTVRQTERPKRAWTITQRVVTLNRISAVGRAFARVRAAHPLPYRAATAESQAAFARAVIDETRDPDQRDRTRNARRHSRGRRAR